MKVKFNHFKTTLTFLIFTFINVLVIYLVFKSINQEIQEKSKSFSTNQKVFYSKIDKYESLLDSLNSKLNLIDETLGKIHDDIKMQKNPAMMYSLREKLIFQYPYDMESKFPALIWKAKKKKNDESYDFWIEKHPGFSMEIFDRNDAYILIMYLYKKIPEVIQTYKTLRKKDMEMFFFRFLILFAKGGVYFSESVIFKESIPNWIPENYLSSKIGLIIYIDFFNQKNKKNHSKKRIYKFNKNVFQSKVGHPVLREIIVKIVEKNNSKSKIEDFNFFTTQWNSNILKYLKNSSKFKLNYNFFEKIFINSETSILMNDVLILQKNKIKFN